MESVNTETYRDSKNRLRCDRCGKIAFYDEWRASDIADRAMRQDRYLRVYIVFCPRILSEGLFLLVKETLKRYPWLLRRGNCVDRVGGRELRPIFT